MCVKLIGSAVHPVIEIENMFSPTLHENILKEIGVLRKYLTSDKAYTGSAKMDNAYLKKNKGLWLETFYGIYSDDKGIPRGKSAIVDGMLSFYTDKNVLQSLSQMHPFFSLLPVYAHMSMHEGQGGFLMSEYEQDGYYDFHQDASDYTLVYYPQGRGDAVQGGELTISGGGGTIITIEPKPNKAVLFPSHYPHKVETIKYKDGNSTPRIGITGFIRHYK